LYSANSSFSFAASGLRLSKPTELGILHLQFPFCWESRKIIRFHDTIVSEEDVIYISRISETVSGQTWVAGVFIRPELSRPRMSCMVTMEVLATEERAAVIRVHDMSVFSASGRYLIT